MSTTLVFVTLLIAALLPSTECVPHQYPPLNVELSRNVRFGFVKKAWKKVWKETKRAGRKFEDEIRRAGRKIDKELRRLLKKISIECSTECDTSGSSSCKSQCTVRKQKEEIDLTCRLECHGLPDRDSCVASCKVRLECQLNLTSCTVARGGGGGGGGDSRLLLKAY